MSYIPIAVRRGADLLDERIPGWRDEIDVDDLQLWNCERCILGQLFGDYDRGVKILGLEGDQDVNLGFHLGNRRRSYDWLTAGWRKLLRR